MASLHGWRAVLFSPEMPTVPHLRDKLRRIRGGSRLEADNFIDEYFRFIDADPTGREDVDFDLDWIIDKATDAVLRDGIRVLVIDPWTRLSMRAGRDESVTDYIGRGIRALKRFARLYDVAVIVVAHPTKDVGRDGKARPPTLYDIEGSAHWFNKCDHGIVVDRPNALVDEAVLRVAKVRFEESGEKGQIRLRFELLHGVLHRFKSAPMNARFSHSQNHTSVARILENHARDEGGPNRRSVVGRSSWLVAGIVRERSTNT
jgi:twinkle protein